MTAETSGFADFRVGSVTYKTWYKIYGDLKSTTHRPLVTVHGGPGMTHQYLLPLAAVHPQAGIPIVFYDQIGCGKSSHVNDAPKAFWNVDLFIDELENLLNHLDIEKDFDLLGQYWGATITVQYAALRIPKGLRRLIMATPICSVEIYEEYTRKLLQKSTENFAQTLLEHQAAGTMDSPECKEAVMLFYRKHLCPLNPWPDDLRDSIDQMLNNPTVLHAMRGNSEFNITGFYGETRWSITNKLHQITCPTLLISSPVYDGHITEMMKHISKVKWIELKNSTRMPIQEEPERFIEVVVEFLSQIEPIAPNLC